MGFGINFGELDMRKIREGLAGDFDGIRGVVAAGLRGCVVSDEEEFEFLYGDVCGILDWWDGNRERAFLLVCEERGVILGVALVKEFWNFAALFVEPGRHGAGIGRALVERVIAGCRGRSPKGCLRLNSSNHAAGFYERMGFVRNGEARDLPGGCVPFRFEL